MRLQRAFLLSFLFLLMIPLWAEEKFHEVSLNVPHSGYSLKLLSLYGDETTWYIYGEIQVPDPKQMYMMAITRISSQIVLPSEKSEVQVYLSGKNWGWPSEQAYTFISHIHEFETLMSEVGAKKVS